MKKLSVILLVLVFVFALSACGNNANNNNLTGGGTKQQGENSQTTSTISSTPSNQNQQQDNQKSTITRDRAIEIALEAASLTKTEVRDLEAELDRERNGVFWEVDFEHGGYDYSYDINANTGEAQRIEKERD